MTSESIKGKCGEQKKFKEKEHLQDIVEAIDFWLDYFGRNLCPSAVGAIIQRQANTYLWPDENHFPYCRYDLIACKTKANEELQKLEETKGWLLG